MKICFHFQNLANPTRIPTNYSPFSPLPEISTPRFTSDYLTYLTLPNTFKVYPSDPFPKNPPFTPTPIPLPHTTPHQLPYLNPIFIFPFSPLPFPRNRRLPCLPDRRSKRFPTNLQTHSHSLTRSSDQENSLESIPNHRTLNDSHWPSSTLINSRTSDSSEEN